MKTSKRTASELEKPGEKRNPPQRSTAISLRLTHDELETFRQSAEACGVGLSEWIRARISVDMEDGHRKENSRPRVVSDPRLLCRLVQISRNLDELVYTIRRHRPFEDERLILEITAIRTSLHMIAGVK